MARTRRHVYIFLAVAIAGSLLYFYLDPSYSRYFPPCVFYKLTGWYCPGCGSQRAFHDLLHGDVLEAAGHNILFVLFVPLMIFAAVAAINNIFRKRRMQQAVFYSALFARAVLVVVLAFWLFRNVPYEPF